MIAIIIIIIIIIEMMMMITLMWLYNSFFLSFVFLWLAFLLYVCKWVLNKCETKDMFKRKRGGRHKKIIFVRIFSFFRFGFRIHQFINVYHSCINQIQTKTKSKLSLMRNDHPASWLSSWTNFETKRKNSKHGQFFFGWHNDDESLPLPWNYSVCVCDNHILSISLKIKWIFFYHHLNCFFCFQFIFVSL